MKLFIAGLLVVALTIAATIAVALVQTHSVRVNAAQALDDCGAGNVQSVHRTGYSCINSVPAA